MANYEITWITPSLAVGYAPMSYEDLEEIKKAGISAIVNLCGEYCDLHEIEEKAGFDVYYLPIPDEEAPDMEEMEKALDWLDEAIFLGKKVLVHCKHGIGRTGTFVMAYLIRKGLGYKKASEKLKGTRASSSSWSQWRLLKRYDKLQKPLKKIAPSLELKHKVDLSVYFEKLEEIYRFCDEFITDSNSLCGKDHFSCCKKYFKIPFVEAVYIQNYINTKLSLHKRHELIKKANKIFKKIKRLKRTLDINNDDNPIFKEHYQRQQITCPLLNDDKCIIFSVRPFFCRIFDHPKNDRIVNFENILNEVSRMLFFALSGQFVDAKELKFTCAEAVSGRFMEIYFKLASSKKSNLFKNLNG